MIPEPCDPPTPSSPRARRPIAPGPSSWTSPPATRRPSPAIPPAAEPGGRLRLQALERDGPRAGLPPGRERVRGAAGVHHQQPGAGHLPARRLRLRLLPGSHDLRVRCRRGPGHLLSRRGRLSRRRGSLRPVDPGGVQQPCAHGLRIGDGHLGPQRRRHRRGRRLRPHQPPDPELGLRLLFGARRRSLVRPGAGNQSGSDDSGHGHLGRPARGLRPLALRRLRDDPVCLDYADAGIGGDSETITFHNTSGAP